MDIIWGTGKDDSLGDKLRVSVIATGFNRNRNDLPNASASAAPLRKTQFKVEEMPEDLEMKVTDSGEEERKARELRRKQEENKARRMRQSEKPRTSPARTPLQGKNAVPDTDSWLKRKFGSIDSLFD